MKRTSLTSLGVVALLSAGLTLAHLSPPDPDPGSPRLAAVSQALGPEPSTRLLVTDPRHDPHGISVALVRDLDHVPAGGSIGVSTYWIGSRRILDALTRA